MFPTTESSGTISLNQLHAECQTRIQQERWCPTIAAALFAISILLVPIVHSAETLIYVSLVGNDSGPCTSRQPCRTIERAEAVAEPGDTIQIAAGTYVGRIRLSKSGTQGKRITYRGHDGECPSTANADQHAPRTRSVPTVITDGWIVEASHLVIDCFHIRPTDATGVGIGITGSGNGANAAIHRSHVDIRNNYVEYGGANCSAGVSMVSNIPGYQSTNIVVAHNFITGCAYGINIRAVDSVIEDNEIYRLRAWSGAGDMDYIRLFGRNLVIRRNYLHGNSVADCNGIACHIDCFQTFNVDGAGWAHLQQTRIESNTCFNAHQGILMQDTSLRNLGRPSGTHDGLSLVNNVIGYGPVGSSSMAWCMLFNSITNVFVYHNTCLSGQVRYRVRTTGAHRNNIHYVGTSSPAATDGSGAVIITDNLFYSPSSHVYSSSVFPGNILNVDPLFQDARTRDFRLTSKSPALGVGAQLGVLSDRNGVLRPSVSPDVGAYQFRGALLPPARLRLLSPP